MTRRANALVLLDDGWSCQEVADAFLLNDDTIRGWFKLFEQRGIEGLTSFDVGGSASFLCVSDVERARARRRIEGLCRRRRCRARRARSAPLSNRRFGLECDMKRRSGLIALLHRLGLEYHKPDIIPRKLNKEKQQAFIESYDNLLEFLGRQRSLLLLRGRGAIATHAARPAGHADRAPRQEKASRSNKRAGASGSIFTACVFLDQLADRLRRRMIRGSCVTVDAVSTIRLLESIAALYPMLALIHVFLDERRAIITPSWC